MFNELLQCAYSASVNGVRLPKSAMDRLPSSSSNNANGTQYANTCRIYRTVVSHALTTQPETLTELAKHMLPVLINPLGTEVTLFKLARVRSSSPSASNLPRSS